MTRTARFCYAGIAVLCAGLATAGLIYAFAAEPAAEPEFANPRAYENQIERIGGKATLYAVRFNEWFSSLWHGKALAFTVALLSVAIALACFWAAARARR